MTTSSSKSRSARAAFILAALTTFAALVCLYVASATSMLRMTECHVFSFTADNPSCRTAMYWSTAAVAMLATASASILVGIIRRLRSSR